ncbi:hypothetical protein ATO8_07601 [Roseivivax marinus]|uniref:Uncharacterized protein n=1 Tax=Roseivivax marinus TaxID=1379903 RepID=W4HKW6_9RHOB|nr:hypothetical protein [Roseivivax marinus]ETW13058.1 hypothetical protein ATO8_07601 [Roseivivax marinus]
MTPKTFSIDLRRDGGARLALSYRAADRAGIQRLACDIAASDMSRLVIFAETLDLQAILGGPVAAELDLEGLRLETEDSGAGIRLVRTQGYNTQTAQMELSTFGFEMAGITEACLARATEAKHGPVLTELLAECPMPETLSAALGPDRAEQAVHVVREMTLLILTEQAATKGSEIARKLRSKTRREDAFEEVRMTVDAVSSAFLAPAAEEPSEVGLRRRG